MFTNEKLARAFETGEYICEECGGLMEFEDEEIRDTLICPKCGFETDMDHYGLTEEEYDALYPTYEELCGREESDDNQNGETYEEVYGELSDD